MNTQDVLSYLQKLQAKLSRPWNWSMAKLSCKIAGNALKAAVATPACLKRAMCLSVPAWAFHMLKATNYHLPPAPRTRKPQVVLGKPWVYHWYFIHAIRTCQPCI